MTFPEVSSTMAEGEKEAHQNPGTSLQGTSDIKHASVTYHAYDASSSNASIMPPMVCENTNSNCENIMEKPAIITTEMLAAETLCHEELLEEENNERKRAMAELEVTIREQRSARLHHLLEKSNFYAKFLLERMEEQKAKRIEARKSELPSQPSKQKVAIKVDQELKANQPEGRVTRQARSTRCSSTSKSAVRDHGKGTKREVKSMHHHDMSDVVAHDTLEKASKRRKIGEQPLNVKAKLENNENHSAQPKVTPMQPKLISGGSLRSYQLEGVEWLKGLFENGINGILADEMGLGKTVQCIGLLAYLIEQGVRGPFLVVGPLSTLPNWVNEFKTFAPQINTLLYHGSKEQRPALRRRIMQLKGTDFKTAPVVITSYEIVLADRKALQGYPWKFIIVDEGHRLKNLNCKLIRELKTIKSANRLLLTGTPLQNNLAELWSLLNFLLPDIFDDLNSFQAWFDFSEVQEEGGYEKIVAKEEEKAVLQKLHAILTPFLLRRVKGDVDLSIPPKVEMRVYAPFSRPQEEFYRAILDKTIYTLLERKEECHENKEAATRSRSGRRVRKAAKDLCFRLALADNLEEDEESVEDYFKAINQEKEARNKARQLQPSVRDSASSALLNLTPNNMLMMLRKCCNHPYLLKYPVDAATQELQIDEELINASGKMLLLDKMLPELKKGGHKVLIFSQMTKMLDILQDYCWLREFQFARLDGSMPCEERQEQIDLFNKDSEVFLFLLSTRAGGLGINLAAADTVIIYDSDWNPQSDLQAQDRAHRIGQQYPVVVYRLVTANSVDESMIERARHKRTLEKMVIHKGRFKGSHAKSLSPDELRLLLESHDHRAVSLCDSTRRDISDESVKELLDRERLFSLSDESNGNQKREVGREGENKQKDEGMRLFEFVKPQEGDVLL